ncbi:MAG: 4-alpha-glucanotransferase [Lachnospiraceae bacterium]|nr:4-alpha-glucanotransferase [Lachnospiraceae bacterium]
MAVKRSKAVSDNGLNVRLSGILVHPTSFPSPYGIGDLGQGAYDFIDFLKKAGQHLWQVLPLGPTGYGNSPYQSYSSFAGQPLMISPDELIKVGLLDKEDVSDIPNFENPLRVDFDKVSEYKEKLLKKAYENFKAKTYLKVDEEEAKKEAEKAEKEAKEAEDKADDKAVDKNETAADKKEAKKPAKKEDLTKKFDKWVKQTEWVADYGLYMAVKGEFDGKCWQEWDKEIAFPTAETKAKWAKKLEDTVKYYEFRQFIFFEQWMKLKEYAHENDVLIVGDIPLYISEDSADAWAAPSMFELDSKGYPKNVAGVPPDYFSATGQRWGNPLYDWKAQKKDGFKWWIARVKAQLVMTDYLRIDHFRGFEAYWSVPATEETAINGKWVKAPGDELFAAIAKEFGDDLPIIAEDLGIITPEVEALRDKYNFPGMKVLQFAFDGTHENAFLPHYYPYNCVCYTGTHDNDTTAGWYNKANEASRDKVRRYMGIDGNNVSWDFIALAFKSVAKYAIVPLQDVMRMDSDARMNTPGTMEGNWIWRYSKDQLKDDDAKNLRSITELYGRL